MQKNEIIKVLISIGWPKNEAKLYVLLLELGAQPASVIAKQLQANRITTYHSLERLVAKKYVTKQETSHGALFSAKNPDEIITEKTNEMKAKENEMKYEVTQISILKPFMDSLQKQVYEKPNIEIFNGTNGLKKIYEISLRSKYIFAYFQAWGDHNKELQTIDDWHTNQRVNHEIPIKIITSNTIASQDFASTPAKFKSVIVINEAEFNFEDVTLITDTHILMYAHADKIGIAIKSKVLAKNQASLFKLAWQQALKTGVLFEY